MRSVSSEAEIAPSSVGQPVRVRGIGRSPVRPDEWDGSSAAISPDWPGSPHPQGTTRVPQTGRSPLVQNVSAPPAGRAAGPRDRGRGLVVLRFERLRDPLGGLLGLLSGLL